MTAEPFKDSSEHLQAELSLLDLLIGREILRARSSAGREQDIFRGMYISDADVDRILANAEPAHTESAAASFQSRIRNLTAELEARKQATVEKGIPLSLPYLTHLFGLTPFEQRVLLMCAAPEMSRKYERLFGYLHDDVSRRRPTVGLVLDVLSPTIEERNEAVKVFSPSESLLRAGILRLVNQTEDTYLRRTLVIDEIVLNHLLGVSGPTGELEGSVRMHKTKSSLNDLRWRAELKEELAEFIGKHLQVGKIWPKQAILHLHGPYGTGKKTLAAALCRTANIPMLVVDLQELNRRSTDLDRSLSAVFRYALLLQAAVYLEHFDCLFSDEDRPFAWKQTLRRLAEEMSLVTFLGTEGPWGERDSFKDLAFLSIDLPLPDAAQRNRIWAETAKNSSITEDVVWEDIASHFRLTPGRIKRAFQTAALLASLRRGQGASRISREDIHRGCYSQSNRKLSTLAQRLVPRYTWSDLIVPENVSAQLWEMSYQLKHRKRVYEDWGFERKLARGKGLCALFYGHSGVGKTMAVEVLAYELHLEIFKIDLSTVVSKYIGETEKNLSRIFREAEDSNSILFFDEADALFGKRSEVKDAHDRYANIEINYLLQRMEDFDGLVVLATNLRRNIDEGFFRRMHFAVELPFPEEPHRYRIWKQQFPQSAPLGSDIDFDYLAKRFALAGGHIRNVALNAAFLAASNSGTIHMEHIIRATKREYEKIGKLCTDSEFAPYQWALRDAAMNLQQSGKP